MLWDRCGCGRVWKSRFFQWEISHFRIESQWKILISCIKCLKITLVSVENLSFSSMNQWKIVIFWLGNVHHDGGHAWTRNRLNNAPRNTPRNGQEIGQEIGQSVRNLPGCGGDSPLQNYEIPHFWCKGHHFKWKMSSFLIENSSFFIEKSSF